MTSDPEILFEDERYTVYRNGLVVDNSTGNADNGVAGAYFATLLAARENKKGIKDDSNKPHLSILPGRVISQLLAEPGYDVDSLPRTVGHICLSMDAEHGAPLHQLVTADLERAAHGIMYAMGIKRPKCLALAARVMMHGAKKYAVDNWRQLRPSRRYADAALRHIFASLAGELNDAETNLPHLAHALCCVIFLLHHVGSMELAQFRQHHDYGLPTQAQLVNKPVGMF